MSEKVYVLGGEQTDFQRNWTKEGKTFMSMMREIMIDALDKVGIDLSEIKKLNKDNRVAVFVGNFDAEQYANQGHMGAFLTEVDPAFFGVPSARYEAACASGSVAIDAAATHIRAKDYDVAIVLGIEVMKTVSSAIGGDFLGTAAYYEKEAKGVQFPFPKLFGKLADVILERYKLKEEVFMDALAEISRINYDNAKRNPKAQTRTHGL
jgi:acetyl-CoA C-acetyltransferase